MSKEVFNVVEGRSLYFCNKKRRWAKTYLMLLKEEVLCSFASEAASPSSSKSADVSSLLENSNSCEMRINLFKSGKHLSRARHLPFNIICLCDKSADSEQCFSLIPACWCRKGYSSPKENSNSCKMSLNLKPGKHLSRAIRLLALFVCVLSQQIQNNASP